MTSATPILLLGLVVLLNSGCAMIQHECCTASPQKASYAVPNSSYISQSKLTVNVFEPPDGAPARAKILLLHELNGMTGETFDFAQRLAQEGFQVHAPILFGGDAAYSWWAKKRNLLYVVFSPQWPTYRLNVTPKIYRKLDSLTDELGTDRPIIVIGMCLTGSLPIALATQPSVRMIVTSQPATPFGAKKEPKASAFSLNDVEFKNGTASIKDRSIRVFAVRFEHDKLSPKPRIESLRGLGLSDELLKILNLEEKGEGKHHSVFTAHYSHDHGSPTREAFDKLVEQMIKASAK